MRPRQQGFSNERGWTYLAVLFAVVLMGISSSVAGRNWVIIMTREREAELLFRGLQIKHAIERYAADYEVRKGTRENIYPLRLEQLVEGPKRYLPRVYDDPITGEDFDLIRKNGEIHGVRSKSANRPLNRIQFQNAPTYSDIRFQALPPSATGQICQGGAPLIINPLNPLAAPACPPPQSPSNALVAGLSPSPDDVSSR